MTIRLILITALTASVIACGALFSSDKLENTAQATGNECVILLHGLCRSGLSMKIIERNLKQMGYAVINVDYASTRKSIAAIANADVAAAVSQSISRGYARTHFVTHSLGAIVVRSYLQHHQLPPGSRIVMLAPPNQGSELVDWAQHHFPRLFRLAGPAANELGTHHQTTVSQLRPITPATGIIIGNGSWNPVYSKILPGSDDGKVTVARAKLEEMHDFLVAPCSHTTILVNRNVRQQVIHFLQNGKFQHKQKRDQKTPEAQRSNYNSNFNPPVYLQGKNQGFLGIGR